MPLSRTALLLIAVSAGACMSAIFDRRAVTGAYCLDFEDRIYFLRACRPEATLRGRTDTGPLEGTVLKIGWNRRFIVAWRRSLARREGDGWMILDTEKQTLEGPLSDEGLRARQQASPEFASIVTYDVEQAWRRLGRW